MISESKQHSRWSYDGFLRPTFHWKLSLRWPANANEMDTNNMKSTWPMPALRVGDPTPPIFHLLALGVGIGGNANFSVRVGGNANFSNFRYQHPQHKIVMLGVCTAILS